VDARIFVQADPLLLRGGRCTSCGTTTFPRQQHCPRCFADEVVDEQLPTTGTLWSWTVQHFLPKPPYRPPAGDFAPYHLGYVDLGSVIIESRLTGFDGRIPVISEPVRLVPLVSFTEDDGTEVVTFAFAPAEEEVTR
jgi:uncharacterized protein